jgi:hypothetical protein
MGLSWIISRYSQYLDDVASNGMMDVELQMVLEVSGRCLAFGLDGFRKLTRNLCQNG